MKQTKIVASISDLRCEKEFIQQLFDNGMNVVRMNTAHATREGLEKIVKNTREVSNHIAIMIDTKGPEVRTTGVETPVIFFTDEIVRIYANPQIETTHQAINVSYKGFVKDVEIGNQVLFDDGELAAEVIDKKDDEYLIVKILNDGRLGSHKSVNVPGVHISLPAITEKDYNNILFAIEQDIDFIAHSFVRNKEDVKAVQDILDEHNSDIKIISKIENQEGVDNIDSIIEASYGVMIARGDLGIEVPIEKIPGLQRKIIRKCVQARKPVIVATQMLHTMINNPRPTRAEVTDIANAIYYRTDALMLSGETASGKYPIEAIKTMATIAEQAEKDKLKENDIKIQPSIDADITEFLAKTAIEATETLNVKGIITDSYTGRTARNLASFRGPQPVLAICYYEKLQRRLALSYGVIPIFKHDDIDIRSCFVAALRMLKQKGFVDMNDKIAYLSGSLGEGGGTTYLDINTVKDVFEKKHIFNLPQLK